MVQEGDGGWAVADVNGRLIDDIKAYVTRYPKAGELLIAELSPQAASALTHAVMNTPPSWEGQGIDAREAADRPAPREFLVEGLVRLRATSLLVADYSHHKSNLQLATGLCVAQGKPFAGLKTERRPVILVCQDQARERIMETLHALAVTYGLPEPSMFLIYSYPQPPLSLVEDLSVFEAALSGLEEPFILIDSLTACAGTEEENTPAMAQALRSLDALRARVGGTCLVNHHTPHNVLRSRGSRLIVAAVEGSLLVTRDNRPDGDFIKFSTEKAGSAPFLKDLVLRFTYAHYPNSVQMSRAEFVIASKVEAADDDIVEAAEDVLAYIREHHACSGRDLRKKKADGGLGMKSGKVRDALEYLEARRDLRHDGQIGWVIRTDPANFTDASDDEENNGA